MLFFFFFFFFLKDNEQETKTEWKGEDNRRTTSQYNEGTHSRRGFWNALKAAHVIGMCFSLSLSLGVVVLERLLCVRACVYVCMNGSEIHAL